jgi:hypothetical protein
VRPIYIGCGDAPPDSETRKIAERLAGKIQSLGGIANGSWVMGLSIDLEGLQKLRREMSEVSLAVSVVDREEPFSLVEFGLLVGTGIPTLVLAADPGPGDITQLGPDDIETIEETLKSYLEAVPNLEAEP